jgi:hypothetical protein
MGTANVIAKSYPDSLKAIATVFFQRLPLFDLNSHAAMDAGIDS